MATAGFIMEALYTGMEAPGPEAGCGLAAVLHGYPAEAGWHAMSDPWTAEGPYAYRSPPQRR